MRVVPSRAPGVEIAALYMHFLGISKETTPQSRSDPVMLVVACLLLLACLLALRLPGEAAHFVKNGGYLSGQKRASSDERSRIGKLALLSRGRFFFDAEFQVWRGRIPEKSSKSGHFPLGVDCV